MGNADQRHGSFLHALAVQIGHAVFGDHVMHVAARGDDAGAGAEPRDDARDRAILGRGRQRDDGFAVVRPRRAAVEVHLAADAGEELRAQRVGADLAGQIHLQRHIDARPFCAAG